jgi:UDP-N-acetyl-D-mannosaminuronic acid dehydrogenase
MLNNRLHVAHAPHRWYALEEKEHGVNQLRVIGGVCDCCLRVAMQFYDRADISTLTTTSPKSTKSKIKEESMDKITRNDDRFRITLPAATMTSTSVRDHGNGNPNNSTHEIDGPNDIRRSSAASIANNSEATTTVESLAGENNKDDSIVKKTSLGIPMHPVPEVEIAELTKIVENAHRYLQIAFAEDLYLYCQANNINFAELRDSLNTKWNVNVLEPREGIGGHCLPKDTKMFLNSSKSMKSKIIEAAIQVDSEYRKYQITSSAYKTNPKSFTGFPDVRETGSLHYKEPFSTVEYKARLVPTRSDQSRYTNM